MKDAMLLRLSGSMKADRWPLPLPSWPLNPSWPRWPPFAWLWLFRLLRLRPKLSPIPPPDRCFSVHFLPLRVAYDCVIEDREAEEADPPPPRPDTRESDASKRSSLDGGGQQE